MGHKRGSSILRFFSKLYLKQRNPLFLYLTVTLDCLSLSSLATTLVAWTSSRLKSDMSMLGTALRTTPTSTRPQSCEALCVRSGLSGMSSTRGQNMNFRGLITMITQQFLKTELLTRYFLTSHIGYVKKKTVECCDYMYRRDYCPT